MKKELALRSEGALLVCTETEDKFATISSDDWKRMFARHRNTHETTTMKQLLALLLVGAAKLSAQDDLKFLEAISAVESGIDDCAVGKHGERGRFQFTPETWFQHTEMPFSKAHDSVCARAVALKHLAYLKRTLETDSYLILAYGWLRGPFYNLPQTMAREHYDALKHRLDYGKRVMAVYESLLTEGE